MNIRAVGPPCAVIGGMLSTQAGTALSVLLLAHLTEPASAWLRLALGAAILLVWVRPRLRGRSAGDLLCAIALGLAVASMTIFSLLAAARIPFGTVSAIEFLGPLGIAVASLRRPRDLLWPFLAAGGVLLLTRPWAGIVESDALGLGSAALAGIGLAAYILLTQRVGDRFETLDGLALSSVVAAVAAALPAWAVGGDVRWDPIMVLLAPLAALLAPVGYQVLEMYALRRMPAASVGVLLSLEPAIALLIGAVVLAQAPAAAQLAGITLVCAAGYGAVRYGERRAAPDVIPYLPVGRISTAVVQFPVVRT